MEEKSDQQQGKEGRGHLLALASWMKRRRETGSYSSLILPIPSFSPPPSFHLAGVISVPISGFAKKKPRYRRDRGFRRDPGISRKARDLEETPEFKVKPGI